MFGYNKDGDNVYEGVFRLSSTVVEGKVLSVKYKGDRVILVNDDVYTDSVDCIVKVFINDNELSSDQYSYSESNKTVYISYKVNIQLDDLIDITYNKKRFNIKFSCESAIDNIKIIPRYMKNSSLGTHTKLFQGGVI